MNRNTCDLQTTFSFKVLGFFALLLWALNLSPLYVHAQGVTTAGMNGIITDENGETLPTATVLAVHQPTGTQYGTTSGADGQYRISNMRVGGPYTVTVSFVGYRTQVYENITLSLGAIFRLDAQISSENLELEELVVSASTDRLFNSDKTGAGQNLSNEKINALPTISRSINDFTRLTPQSNGTSFAGRDNRFNNYTIDGNIYNNNFGLGSSQFAGGNPISLDAIEEVQVNLAPFDVRQGGFTGASVNAITKSGTNEFKATAYMYYRNENFIGDRIGDVRFEIADTYTRIRGASVGGPIIKDKLFFFVSVEDEESDAPGDNRRAARPGLAPDGVSVSRVTAEQAEFVRAQMQTLYGYDTGGYELTPFSNAGTRINARLDWNINNNHRAMVRFNRFENSRDVIVNGNSIRGFPGTERYRNTSRSGIEALTFSNTNYAFDNIINSFVGELNSTFGDKIANNFNIGFTNITDPKRSVPGGQTFPMIEILEPDNGQRQYFMSLGNELFTVGNLLENEVFNITNNTTFQLGNHTLTAGFNYEYMTFSNAFNPVWNSWYRYQTYDDFVRSVIQQDPSVVPSHFAIGFTYDADNPTTLPLDQVEFAQLGVYLQDEFQVTPDLRITAGLRVDMPFYPGDLPRNPAVEALGLNIDNPVGDGSIRPDVSQLPKVNPLFSPRIGFNWDVNGDRSFQVRGGTGVFSGRLPFVWISNQVNANGVMRGQLGILDSEWGQGNNPAWQGFQPDVNFYRPDPSQIAASVPSQINITDRDFRLPQVWRTSLAADKKLGNGFRASLEGVFGLDFNSPLAANLAHQPTGESVNVGGNEYPLYTQAIPGAEGSGLREMYFLTNIDEGSYASITAELEKTFDFGLFTRIAYTRSRARDYGLIGGSQAQSLWPTGVVEDRNNPEIGFSRFDVPNRIVAEASLNTSQLGVSERFNTMISLLYIGGDQGRYSYLYDGSFGDGSGVRLMYVPNSFEDAQLVDIVDGNGVVVRTAEQQWADLDAFISQDDYLSDIRGEVSERNGAVLPWRHRFDFRVAQDIGVYKGAKVQLTMDVLNIGNLLNSEWGVSEAPIQTNLLRYVGADAQGNAQFTVNNAPGTDAPARESFRIVNSINETWSAQFGVRVSFN